MTRFRHIKTGDIFVPHRFKTGVYKGAIYVPGKADWKEERNNAEFRTEAAAIDFLKLGNGACLRMRNARTGKDSMVSMKNLEAI